MGDSGCCMAVGAETGVLLRVRRDDYYTKQSAGFWGVRGGKFWMILGKNAKDTGFEAKDTGFEVKDTGVRRIERGNREMRQTAPPRKPRMGLRARVAT